MISAAGHKLSGLSLRQALDILRSSPPITTLCVCRPKNLLDPISFPRIAREQRFNNKRIRSYSFTPASLQQVHTHSYRIAVAPRLFILPKKSVRHALI